MATLNITGAIIDSPVSEVTASTYVNRIPDTVRRTAAIVDSPDVSTTTTIRVDHIPVTIRFTSQVIDSPVALATATVRVDHTPLTVVSTLYSPPVTTVDPVYLSQSLRVDHPDTSVNKVTYNIYVAIPESTATTAGPSFYW